MLRILRAKQGARSLRDFAANELNCSAAYLSKVFSEETDPGPVVLNYLGLEREVRVDYKPIKPKRRWR